MSEAAGNEAAGSGERRSRFQRCPETRCGLQAWPRPGGPYLLARHPQPPRVGGRVSLSLSIEALCFLFQRFQEAGWKRMRSERAEEVC